MASKKFANSVDSGVDGANWRQRAIFSKHRQDRLFYQIRKAIVDSDSTRGRVLIIATCTERDFGEWVPSAPSPKIVDFFVDVRNSETDISMQSTVQEESKSKIARKLWQPEAPNALGASASVRDAIVPLFDIQTKFADQI